MKKNAYINDGNTESCSIGSEMKPNRLVIFDERMLHSQHIALTQLQAAFA